jgi:hypothetical protein
MFLDKAGHWFLLFASEPAPKAISVLSSQNIRDKTPTRIYTLQRIGFTGFPIEI